MYLHKVKILFKEIGAFRLCSLFDLTKKNFSYYRLHYPILIFQTGVHKDEHNCVFIQDNNPNKGGKW